MTLLFSVGVSRVELLSFWVKIRSDSEGAVVEVSMGGCQRQMMY